MAGAMFKALTTAHDVSMADVWKAALSAAPAAAPAEVETQRNWYSLASRINDIVRLHDPEQHLADGGNSALVWKIEAELNKSLTRKERP